MAGDEPDGGSSGAARERRASERPDTRGRILEAAKAEFAGAGLAGARVDEIARRAGCNKQLIYHYFGDKTGLFEAALTDVLEERDPIAIHSRADFENLLPRVFADGAHRRRILRMLVWESLADESRILGEAARRTKVTRITGHIRELQSRGLVDPDLPPCFVLVVVFAAVTLPWVLPTFVRLATGHGPAEPEFRAGYEKVLRAVARGLAPAPG